MPSSCYSREGSCETPTIHERRSRSRNSTASPTPPALNGLGEFFHSRVSSPISIPESKESDAACWERMLMLQREYHCYKSARLEAAVEAIERGAEINEVPMPPRICLDLLNEELKAQIEAHREGLI
ncbi:hypothetical protein B0O99DRAFT_685344 [Bisporella sp. PMI_857]|nr:hypothetical protein B0O99DRAFT_685344 [Bisporella sp. PMI_857]